MTYPPSDNQGPPASRSRLAGNILGVIVLVLVLAVAVVVFTFHRHTAQPDVAAVAGSSQVDALDAKAVAATPGLLKQVTGGESWLAPGPSAMVDECDSSPPAAVGSAWGPVSCYRTTTEYLGFNGDFAQQIAAWDADLTSAGWHPLQGLQTTLTYFQEFEGKPRSQNPGRAYLATDLPTAQYLRSADAQVPGRLQVGVSFAERGATTVDPTTSEQGVATPGSGFAPKSTRRADVAAVESTLFEKYQYVAIVRLTVDYYN